MKKKQNYIMVTAFALSIYLTFCAIVYNIPNGNTAETIINKSAVTDATITANIKSTYLTNSAIRSLDIRVETVNGTVILKGTVPNNDIKDEVENIAWTTDGVKDVTSSITVREKSSTLKDSANDVAITTALKAKYLADTDVKSFNISVETINAKVTLRGTVSSREIKEKIESIAWDTEGVKDVKSKLTIAGKSKNIKVAVSDATITTAIKAKYFANSDIKSLNLHVETVNGKVSLTGTVPNDQVKNSAEIIAWNTDGVKEVLSKLELGNY